MKLYTLIVKKSVAALLPMIVSSSAPLGLVQGMKSGLPESPDWRVPVATVELIDDVPPETVQPLSLTVAGPIRGLWVPSAPRP